MQNDAQLDQQLQEDRQCQDIQLFPQIKHNDEFNKSEGEVGNLCSSGKMQENQIKLYYDRIFSPSQTTKSIKQRNQSLQIAQFYLPQKPNDKLIFQRRQNKVQKLLNKQSQQITILKTLEQQNYPKFKAILEVIKYISQIKDTLKVDYYSNKTFTALIASDESELTLLLKVLTKMYNQLIQQQDKQDINSITKQLLIIPRFLISKEKLQKFIHDQQLQDNLKFLVSKLCLGHQNNQANKKFPDKLLMSLIKDLLNKQNGKEIFKIICSINHGNNYRLKQGDTIYSQLYTCSIQTLREIEKEVKSKNKKSRCSQSQNTIVSQQIDEDKSQIQQKVHKMSKFNNKYRSLNENEQKSQKSSRKIKSSYSLNQRQFIIPQHQEPSIRQITFVPIPETYLPNINNVKMVQNIIISGPISYNQLTSKKQNPKIHQK